MTENEKLVDKIARVLHMAEEFRRHGEDGSADAALARAEEMMMRHQIDMAAVAARRDDRNRPDDPIIKVTLSFTGIYKVVFTQLAVRVARALGTLELIHNPGYRKSIPDELWVLGHTSDVEHAQQLIASIQMQCLTALETWWRAVDSTGMSAMDKFKDRRQFIAAFGMAAGRRIERAREALLADKETGPGTEVVLRDRRSQVTDFMNANFATVSSKGPKMKSGTNGSYQAGAIAGKNAVTGETRVGSSRLGIGS